MDVPLKGYVSWTNAHSLNPTISIPKPLPTKSELLRVQKEQEILDAMKDVKRHTKKAIAIKKLNMVNSGAGVVDQKYSVTGSKFDNWISEETSWRLSNLKKIKLVS